MSEREVAVCPSCAGKGGDSSGPCWDCQGGTLSQPQDECPACGADARFCCLYDATVTSAHDDRIRADALAPVLALADDAERRYAFANASMSAQTGDVFDVPAVVSAAALRAAAGTPTHDTTEEGLMSETEALAESMHYAYEDAAIAQGWETQERSRVPWADVPEANKATMRAMIRAVVWPAVAEAWGQGMRCGSSRAMRHMSDEPNLPLASPADNPYPAPAPDDAEGKA